MIPKAIEIGPLAVHLYGIIIALAIFTGWLVAKKRAHLYQIPKALFDDPILLVPLILAIVGARLYHVFDYWDFYFHNPLSAVNIQNGGLGIWGGLFGAFIGFLIVAKVKKLQFWSVLDLASPALILGQAIGRFGNFVNQEAFGPPTNLPWGIFIRPENRPAEFASSTHFHPTFFYEAILDAIFFVILIYLSKPSTVNRQQTTTKPGQTFALYLILYSIGRFIVEFWRIDTATIENFKVAHVLSIIAFILGIVLLAINKKEALPR